MNGKDQIWVEKYEPSCIDDYIFQSKDNEDFIKSCITRNVLPNLMISGVQGTGKSSLVNVMMNAFNVLKIDIKSINASSDNGIDNVRDTIDSFCSSFANGEFKVIILEEADGLTVAAQKALRSVMDEHKSSCRFIFTCNYPYKIMDAIHSRCQSLYLDAFDEGTMLMHVASILDKENIKYDGNVVIDHVKKFNPDMRKVIQSLQQSSTNAESVLYGVMTQSVDDLLENWSKVWQTNPSYDALLPLVKFVDNTNFEALFKIAYENFEQLPKDDIFKAYATIPDYIERGYIVAYQPMNMHGFLIEIFNKV